MINIEEEYVKIFNRVRKKANSRSNIIFKIFRYYPKFIIDILYIYKKYNTNYLPVDTISKELNINNTFLKEILNQSVYRKYSIISARVFKIKYEDTREYLYLYSTPLVWDLFNKYKDNIITFEERK